MSYLQKNECSDFTPEDCQDHPTPKITTFFSPEKEGRKMLDDDQEGPYWPNCDTSVWMRSCENEVVTPISGKCSGQFPVWLKGTLLRNGPGSLKVGEHKFDHLFDGSALLHRFGIKNGKVTYQRRFVQTEVYKRNHAAKRIILTEFGTKGVPDPCQSIFQRVSAIFNVEESSSDNSMISIYPFGDEFYTFTETPFVHRIDPETLETKERLYISKYVSVVNHTSHPHVMSDGTVYNVGLSLTARGPAYSVVCFPSSRSADDGEKREDEVLSMFDRAKIVATVHSRWTCNPSYMHTFGITDNYFIIIEQPLAIALITLVACQFRNEPMCTSLKWYENENTLIHVISRKTGQTEKTFVAEAFFYLHIINQFESSDNKYVVLDVCCYKDAKMLDCMYTEVMKDMHKDPDYAKLFRGRPLRFVLPMEGKKSGEDPSELGSEEIRIGYQSTLILPEKGGGNGKKLEPESEEASRLISENVKERKASARRLPDGDTFVIPELLCDLGCETPRINYQSHLGKEYRYFYAISSDVDLHNPGTLIKVDTVTKTRKTWCEENVYPSEPIFVPRPDGEAEDDGVVLSALVWGRGRETEVGLLVLDATTFEEIARSTFVTPGPVPKCLHGWFDPKN